jgi:small subunit ribosomal protein S17
MTTSTQNQKVSKAPTLTGLVVSNKMQKTLVVAVETLKTHPKYKKQYRSTKRYKVHVNEGEYAIGQKVSFRECRPVSKDKHHVIVTE